MNYQNQKEIFKILLHPQRSLSIRGFYFIMFICFIISLSVGLFFYSLGAWPVIGFFGLDILLIYLAFKINYKSAKKTEKIILTHQELIVERQKLFGGINSWKFKPPHWVKVTIKSHSNSSSRVVLSSHGEAIFIGDSVSEIERIETANKIKDGLERLKLPS